MNDISELYLPDDCRYSEDHEWARIEGDVIRVGISDYAQDQLGDIIFVELSEAGHLFGQNDVFGTVESAKAVSELLIPLSGEVVRVNEKLLDMPELVNESPYDSGWMIELRLLDESEFDNLMDSATYLEFLKM
ncbi:glycine cleavage system protein GcvH [Candidatus Latescibacterota bacterium]